MNRIKEALEAGKAIRCATEDEARQLFEIMGWRWSGGQHLVSYYYKVKHYSPGWDDWEGRNSPEGREVVPFSTLARSLLADVLGVEEGREFWFGENRYIVDGSDIRSTTGVSHKEAKMKVVLMIDQPERIHLCPVWSEESIKAARVFEKAGFSEVTRHEQPRAYMLLEVTDGGAVATSTDISPEMFPEVLPGQTVALSEIK